MSGPRYHPDTIKEYDAAIPVVQRVRERTDQGVRPLTRDLTALLGHIEDGCYTAGVEAARRCLHRAEYPDGYHHTTYFTEMKRFIEATARNPSYRDPAIIIGDQEKRVYDGEIPNTVRGNEIRIEDLARYMVALSNVLPLWRRNVNGRLSRVSRNKRKFLEWKKAKYESEQ